MLKSRRENIHLDIRKIGNGLFESNTWLAGESGLCTVIDCGAPAADILEAAKRMACRITHVILTHGHVDHICEAEGVIAATGAILCIHRQELQLYRSTALNGYGMFGLKRGETFPLPERLLEDGDILVTGGPSFRILHSPGHTAGGICVLTGKHLFSGDTLFRHGVGRSDLPTGDGRALVRTLREKIYGLDPDIAVHCGHGPDTSIGEEKEHNPYVRIS
jgi:hydroxyacylglutathione hydrolase